MSQHPLGERPTDADLLAALVARTPARVLVGRAGPTYRTATQLPLRRDHAPARDAVHADIDLARGLGADLVRHFGRFELATRATGKQQYLLRPDPGRQLGEPAQSALRQRCPAGAGPTE